MRRTLPRSCAVALAPFVITTIIAAAPPATIGERPAVETHLNQGDIEGGHGSLKTLMDHGAMLFSARFNALDGQGRPACTGTGDPRDPDEPNFIRTSAPEANSCAGCHAQPRPGGSGDFVANVFVLAQAYDPVTYSVHADYSNERNTPGMFGSGPIEMLAREMSQELIAIREEARSEAQATGLPVTRALWTKGVSFGAITAMPDGKIDPTLIEGVDWDLIIKPFHQKGAAVSIRQFTNNALNHHHGMQPVERFGAGSDLDGDGYVDEITVGDVTALTIFQAALGVPTRVEPQNPAQRAAAEHGEIIFTKIGCATCHVPAMVLLDRHFTEPNPFNPPGNLHPDDVEDVVSFDMTTKGERPRLQRIPGGAALVEAFTDLKRHNLNDDLLDHFANEQLPQGMLTGFASPEDFTVEPQPRPTEQFITRKLWDAGSSDPYGHRGDLTTLTEAIYYHGGEARPTRDTFFAMPQADQDAVIEFLKTLQVLEKKEP